MENTNTKLLQALRNSGTEKIFEAYHWLQEHRHEFKKEVYGPVLLEVCMLIHKSFFSCYSLLDAISPFIFVLNFILG